MSNAIPSLPAIDLRGSSSAGSEQSISPRKSNSNSIQDGRNSPRGSAGGPTPVVTIPALSSTSTFTAAVDATSNMLKQLLPAALSPRSPTSPTAGRSPTAASGGIVSTLSQSLRLRRTPSSDKLNTNTDRPARSPSNLGSQPDGVREGKHDELADMSLELIIEAMPAREMFITFCKEQFGCPQKPRFLDQARLFRTEGLRMPTKEALRFSTFLMDTYVKTGAAQDVGLSPGVVEETQARWEGFKGHIQDVMASTQGEKAIAAAVDKKRFHTVFAAAENEVSIYLNETVLPALRSAGGHQAERIHRTSLDWTSIEDSC